MGPVLCNYYVTYRCNATCGFCDIWEQPSPLIDLADAEVNLRDLKRLGVRIIDFTGGEPLLHPQIGSLLSMAKEHGFLTTLTTNGLLYPKRAEELAGLVDMLHFSIDAATPAKHNASRGVACFDKLMESIDRAMAIGECPDLLFTVTDDNLPELERIYSTISFPNRLILIINPVFAYHGRGGGLSSETMDAIETFSRRPYTYLNHGFLSLRRRGGNDTSDPACRAVSTCVVISPFNELVLPCYHLGLDHIPIHNRLYEVWHSETVAAHRANEGRHEGCEGCSINCYFEPSFATRPASRYFWDSLPSTLSYSWTKFVVQRLAARDQSRTAQLPDLDELERASGDGQEAAGMVPLPVLNR